MQDEDKGQIKVLSHFYLTYTITEDEEESQNEQSDDEEFKNRADSSDENSIEVSPYLPASWKEIEEEQSNIARTELSVHSYR